MSGLKHDLLKDRWDLLPIAPVREVVRVLTFGAAKYADNNWQTVAEPGRRYYAAALRHITAWRGGERNDQETGLHHLAHAMCCLAFLLWFELDGKDIDRPPVAKCWVCGKAPGVVLVMGEGLFCGDCHADHGPAAGDVYVTVGVLGVMREAAMLCPCCNGASPTAAQMDHQLLESGDSSGACGLCNNTHAVTRKQYDEWEKA